jgi:RNA polymerase sigma-70 factor, ECF subfamily
MKTGTLSTSYVPLETTPEEAIARGSYRDALAMCARLHGQAIGRLCMALTGSQAEADELVQETLLLAHDSFASYRGDGPLRAWLLTIARRVCARHVETRTRHARLRLVHSMTEIATTRGHAEAPEDIALAREDAARARRALETLKPSERDAILLRYEAGLSYRDVGVACGIDEASARKRVSRALARLREVMMGDGGEPETRKEAEERSVDHER